MTIFIKKVFNSYNNTENLKAIFSDLLLNQGQHSLDSKKMK